MNPRTVLKMIYTGSVLLVAASLLLVYEFSAASFVAVLLSGYIVFRVPPLRPLGAAIPALMFLLPAGGPAMLPRIVGIITVLAMFEMEAALLCQRPEDGWRIVCRSMYVVAALTAAAGVAYLLYQQGVVLPAWSVTVALIPLTLLLLSLARSRSGSDAD